MSHVVQERVVNRLSNIAHRPLHVSGGDDLVGARSVLICGKNADLPTCHLLFVNVHRLREREKDENWGVSGGTQHSFRCYSENYRNNIIIVL